MFYDYETFGKHPALDKPSQFSCVRTDINFNVISPIKEFFCCLPVDYFPDPESILITGISPKYISLYGINEFEFSKKIHSLFMKFNNTCIVGYNNVYFDDEFTRNIFYRNFLNSYEWSWKNGNSRWDILDVLRACYVLRPEGINWPRNKNNSLSLKLSDVSAANNVVHDLVHNASSDVYATLQIAKLLKKTHLKLFNFFFKYRTKKALLTLVNVNNVNPIIHISRFFGMIRNYVSCIVPILWHPINSNILVCVDLSKDVQKILNFFKQEKFLNCNFREIFLMGIKFVYINRCPILAPMNVIRLQDNIRLKIDLLLCKRKLILLRNNVFFKKKLENFLNISVKVQQYSSLNVDLKIYDSFFNRSDNKIIEKIHYSLPKRININLSNCDSRIVSLLMFCLARNYPTLLSNFEKKIWIQHYLKIMNCFNVKKYEKKVLDLLKKNKDNPRNMLLLQELLQYIKNINKKFFNSVFVSDYFKRI